MNDPVTVVRTMECAVIGMSDRRHSQRCKKA